MEILKMIGTVILGVVIGFISAAICSAVGASSETTLQVSLGLGIGVPAVIFIFWGLAFMSDEIDDNIRMPVFSIIALVAYIAGILCLAFITVIWLAVVIFLVCDAIAVIYKRNQGLLNNFAWAEALGTEAFLNTWMVIQAIIYIVLPLVGRFAFDAINWYCMLAPSIILIVGVIVSFIKRGDDYDKYDY